MLSWNLPLSSFLAGYLSRKYQLQCLWFFICDKRMAFGNRMGISGIQNSISGCVLGYIHMYFFFSLVRTEIQQPSSQETTHNSFHEIRISLRLSLELYANVSWPGYSSLKSVFAPFVGAPRFYTILISIDIFTEYHTILMPLNPVPFFMSWFIMINFNNIMTSKFFEIFCDTDFVHSRVHFPFI
jgi:hypothetical protein